MYGEGHPTQLIDKVILSPLSNAINMHATLALIRQYPCLDQAIANLNSRRYSLNQGVFTKRDVFENTVVYSCDTW